MTREIFFSIDLGTQGARVACFDKSGARLAIAEQGYETRYPKPGWAEQSPKEWWQAICNCSKKVMAELPQGVQVSAVCVGATSSTVLAVDSDGNPMGDAILWMDTRCRRQCDKINATGHKALYPSGGAVSVEWMLPKTLWIKEEQSQLYRDADHIVEALDWLNWKLTGRLVASKCNASCKWTYNDQDGDFLDDFFEAIGFAEFRDKWPTDVLAMGEPIGPLTREICDELDIVGSPLLIQGGIDAHVGMLGLGAVVPGRLAVIMGTSFVHLGLTPDPLSIPGLWGPYSNAVVPGYYLMEGGQTSAAAITRWFRDNFAKDLGQDGYGGLAREAAGVEPGADGLVVLDFWQGNRTPFKDPDLSGTIWGMDLHHTRGHLYRAILESVAHGTRNILTSFTDNGFAVDNMVICGGATKNPLWMQIIADICKTPIVLTRDADAVLLGGALASAVGTGVYDDFSAASDIMVKNSKIIEPDGARSSLYDKAHQAYLATHQALAPLMHAAGKE